VARFARGRPAQWVRLPRVQRAPEPPPGSTPGRHFKTGYRIGKWRTAVRSQRYL